ncbi:MAG: hypothetical protein ACD_72C00288G0002, partial [uncultured bacterium]
APWLRRIITRALAIVPAVAVILIFGTGSLTRLLVLSQVVLSLQLPFAVFPLVYFTSKKECMGDFANRRLTRVVAWLVAAIIVFLNACLLFLLFK